MSGRARRAACGIAMLLVVSRTAGAEEPESDPEEEPEPVPVVSDPAPVPDEPPAVDATKPDHASFSAKAELGADYRRFFSVPMELGDVKLSFGAQRRDAGVYLGVEWLAGGTEYGLGVRELVVTASGELILERLRLGADARPAYMAIRRATTGSWMGGYGMGAGLHASYDLWREGPRAMFATIRFNAEIFKGDDAGDPVLWGPGVGFGFRL